MSTTASTVTFDLVEYKPNKKVYLVLDGEDIVDYVVKAHTQKKSGTRVFKMHHSTGEQWTEHTKGQLIATMYDDGNVIKFSFPDKSFKMTKLEYSELSYLRILSRIKSVEDGDSDDIRITEVQKSYCL